MIGSRAPRSKVRAKARSAALLAVLAYAALRGLLLIDLVAPWQGPDEPGHAEYALLLASRRAWPDADPGLQARILGSLRDERFWTRAGLPAPPPSASRFDDVPSFAGELGQTRDETPLAYLPPALALGLLPDAGLVGLLRGMRLSSLALALLAIGATALAARWALGDEMSAPAAALLAAAPLVGFASAILNPDAFALAVSAAFFASWAGAMRRPSPAAVALLPALALLGALARRSALFLAPLSLWAAYRIWREAGAPRPGRRAGLGLALLAGVALALLLWPRGGMPTAWRVVGEGWGAVRSPASARSGSHGLRVIDASAEGWQYLAQWRPTSGGAEATAEGWLRAPEGGRASLVLSDDAGLHEARLVELAPGRWTRVTLRARLTPDARRVRLAIVPGDGTIGGRGLLDADDLRLRVAGRDVLRGGDAEAPQRRAERALELLAARLAMDRLARALPAALGSPAEAARAAGRGGSFLWRSLWGGFGWLALWPGPPLSAAGSALGAAALAALALALTRPRALAPGDPRGAAFLRGAALGFLLALAVAWIGAQAGAGPEKLPQGRYLLPALPAVALVLAAGSAALVRRAGRAPARGAALLAAAVLVYDLVLVLGVILPGLR